MTAKEKFFKNKQAIGETLLYILNHQELLDKIYDIYQAEGMPAAENFLFTCRGLMALKKPTAQA